MSKENLHLLVAVRVWNGDKLNFTNLQEVFDLACPCALLEWLEVVGRPISVDFSVGNYQKNGIFVVIAGQQAGVSDVIATQPTINENCGVSNWGVKIARTAPLQDLLACEFITANKIDHPWVKDCEHVHSKQRSSTYLQSQAKLRRKFEGRLYARGDGAPFGINVTPS